MSKQRPTRTTRTVTRRYGNTTRTTSTTSYSKGGGGAFLLLLLIGFAIKFWPWVLAAALITVAVMVGRKLYRKHQAEVARVAVENAATAARADAEYNAMQSGDLATGIYGQYQPPEELK